MADGPPALRTRVGRDTGPGKDGRAPPANHPTRHPAPDSDDRRHVVTDQARTATAAEAAVAASQSVRLLRDLSHAVDDPLDAWDVLVHLADIPGRLANVYSTLAEVIQRMQARGELERDDGADPAADLAWAQQSMRVTATAFMQARVTSSEPSSRLSRIRLRAGVRATRGLQEEAHLDSWDGREADR